MNNEAIIQKAAVVSVIDFLNSEQNKIEISQSKRQALKRVSDKLVQIFNIKVLDYTSTPKINILKEVQIAELEIALKRNKDLAEYHKHFGNHCMRNRKFPEAVQHFTLAHNFDPKNSVYLCHRAEAYTYMLSFFLAIQDCEQSLKINPKYARAYNRLGILYMNLKKWNEAVEAFQNCFKYENSYFYYINLKNALKAQNATTESERRSASSDFQDTDCKPLDLSKSSAESKDNSEEAGSLSGNLAANDNEFVVNPTRLAFNKTQRQIMSGADQDLDPCGPYFFLS